MRRPLVLALVAAILVGGCTTDRGAVLSKPTRPSVTPSPSPPIFPAPSERYPRGAFEWCPDLAGTLPVRTGMQFAEAERVAEQFARAFLSGDWRTVRSLLDPAASPLRKRHWSVAGKPARVKVDTSGLASGLVRYGCGKTVRKRSVAVVLDDGTRSASADFNLYLVRRADSWKVWASY
jgi:hypothetical protein